MKGSGRGLFQNEVPALTRKNREKSRKAPVCFAGPQVTCLPNNKQEYQHLGHSLMGKTVRLQAERVRTRDSEAVGCIGLAQN
jgi:hypothetical protein